MRIQVQLLEARQVAAFKRDMQEAFQKGTEEEYGPFSETILPESHIDASLNKSSSVAYAAMAEGQMVGGAIVQIDEATRHHHLDFLYVKHGTQSRGVGQAIWNALERLYPDALVWETGTPYFEKRNIHFYVNKCGFHIVEFFNAKHPEPSHPDMPDCSDIPGFEHGFFRFEKRMTASVS